MRKDKVEAKLFAKARAGSSSALDSILDAQLPFLNSLVVDPSRPSSTSSVLLESALAEARRRFNQFRGEGVEDFRVWLCHLMMRVIEKASQHGDLDEDVDASRSTVLVLDALRGSIDRLPEPARTVILCRYRDRLSFARISEVVGLSEAEVLTMWLKGIELLRPGWEDQTC